MAPLQLLVAAAFAMLSPSSAATNVEEPQLEAPASAVHALPLPSARVASFDASGVTLPHDLLRILYATEQIGMTRVDRTSRLVSSISVTSTDGLPIRDASWAAVSEPPRLPVIYGRMMSFDF
jgi:hypothetical protein